MCLSCLELARIFNKSIQKAQQVEDFAWESRLKEKREYFLREIFEKDHNAAYNLWAQTKDDEIPKDSDVLDGKHWSELLEEKFIAREKILFPPPLEAIPTPEVLKEALDSAFKEHFDACEKAMEDAAIFGQGAVKIKETETGWKTEHVQYDPFYTPPKADLDLAVKPPCSHEWFDYEGAGTKPKETICRHCGQLKS